MRARRPHHTRFDCPRNLLKLSSHCSPVNSLCTQDFHLFLHKRGARPSAPIQPLGSSVYAQQNVIFRLRGPMPNRQQAAAEEDSFEKRSLGGSCDNAKTLRGTLSPNEAPWPGLICRISLYLDIRCRTSDESFTKYARLATRCSR